RPRPENMETALVREPQSLLPQGRLADPRLALEQQRLTGAGHVIDECRKREQLVRPANHLVCHPDLARPRCARSDRVPVSRQRARRERLPCHCAPGAPKGTKAVSAEWRGVLSQLPGGSIAHIGGRHMVKEPNGTRRY